MRTYVNLLPFQYRQGELLRRRLLQWSFVCAACAAIAVGVWWLKQSHYRASLRAKDTAERSYVPLEKLIHERDQMRTELHQLHAHGTVLGQLRAERPPLTLIGATSRSARQCGGRLVVYNVSFERKEPSAVVAFEGEALDNVAVATFVVGLRDTGLFRRVELKSSVGKTSADSEVQSFLVQCDI